VNIQKVFEEQPKGEQHLTAKALSDCFVHCVRTQEKGRSATGTDGVIGDLWDQGGRGMGGRKKNTKNPKKRTSFIRLVKASTNAPSGIEKNARDFKR